MKLSELLRENDDEHLNKMLDDYDEDYEPHERTLDKIQNEYGGSTRDVHNYWMGGGSATKYAEMIEKEGYDPLEGWSVNKDFFEKAGISKLEYDELIQASL